MIVDVFFKLEVRKDIFLIQFFLFNGDVLLYIDFIDYFKIYIYDKVYFIDDM